MKTYKTIFQIDFPLAFQLIDELGKVSKFLADETKNIKNVTGRPQTDIDLSKHTVTNQGNIGSNFYRITLTPVKLSAGIEFPLGEDIEKLHQSDLLKIVDRLLDDLLLKEINTFNRIGMRNWVISKGDKLRFSQIRNVILGKINSYESAISSSLGETEDVAVIVESKSKMNFSSRVSFGPYRENEKQRYFSMSPDVDEGLVFDIDIWQTNISLPGLVMMDLIRHWKKHIEGAGVKITGSILESL